MHAYGKLCVAHLWMCTVYSRRCIHCLRQMHVLQVQTELIKATIDNDEAKVGIYIYK
jgi:hypothetical protein